MQADHSTDSSRNPRLLVLRVLMKLMLMVALLVSLWVMLRTMSDPTESGNNGGESTVIQIADIEPGQVQFFDWGGRPVVVVRRLPEWQTWLQNATDKLLLDPQSARSQQPAAASNALRSASPEWFVALALGTDLGCTIEYLPPSHRLYKREPWRGGFVDTCRKSRYDLSGRVFRGPFATANLVVPKWQLDTASQTIRLQRAQ